MVLNVLRNILVPLQCRNTQLLGFCLRPTPRKIDQFHILKEKILSNTSGFSAKFVDSVKHEVFSAGNRVNSDNFDSLFMETCIHNNLCDLGKSFFHYIYQRNVDVSLALVRKYFKLCFHFKDSCTESDKELLISLYEKVMKDYPALDAVSCECLSMGLSITDKWPECVKLLQMSKEYGDPTSQLYSSIIIAAFQHRHETLGWDLLTEMMENTSDWKPRPSVCSAILNEFSDNSVRDLFKYLETYGLYIPEETALVIKKNKGGNITEVSPRGACQTCHEPLAPILVSDSEFKELTEDFLIPVLVGKDIFIKSRPSELENFKDFLDKSDKVDVVLDGLNIAFAGVKKTLSTVARSEMLVAVVKHFVRKDARVMLLGREHMNKWPKSHMNFIRDNAAVFLAEDLSYDDPFLLYATMYNGLGTKFVSRDLMRGHKYLLKTPRKKKIFFKWQQKHQLLLSFVEKNGTVILKNYSSYLMAAQCRHGVWHVPIEPVKQPGLNPQTKALNTKWLCVQLTNHS